MLSAVNSALSALQAFGTKIQSNANNVANSNTEGYKRTRVLMEETAPQGVKAMVEKSTNAGPSHYEETTNGLELIEQSNVDLAVEFTDMMVNSSLYKANIKSLQIADEMMQSTLDLKA